MIQLECTRSCPEMPRVGPGFAAALGVMLLVGERGGLGWPEQPGGFGELGEVRRWWAWSPLDGAQRQPAQGCVGSTRAPGVPEPAPASGKMLSKKTFPKLTGQGERWLGGV